MLLPISLFLPLLIFLAACSGINPNSYHPIRPTYGGKSAPAHVTPTSKSLTSTSGPVAGYLTSDNQHLLWIQWKESSPGNIQGIWHGAYYNVHNKTVKDFDAPFTGTLSGESINIDIHYSLLITVSASGTLKGKDLHVTLSKGSRTIDAYGTSQAMYEQSLRQLQTGHA